LLALLLSGWFLSYNHFVVLDGFSDLTKMVKGILFIHPVKHLGGFSPAIAGCLAAAPNLPDARRYDLQYLVTNIVPVDVIELLEVIDIQHRHA
jgi:hypothetical protein